MKQLNFKLYKNQKKTTIKLLLNYNIMKKENSKFWELDLRSIKTTVIYMSIIFATFYTTNIEFINNILNNLELDKDLIRLIILSLWFLSKKILTDYSK